MGAQAQSLWLGSVPNVPFGVERVKQRVKHGRFFE